MFPASPDREQHRAELASRVVGLRVSLDSAQIASLVGFAELLARWGSRINLSGHRTTGEILERLVLDALALGAAIRQLIGSWPEQVVDLGAGAGLPGIPLAIANPDSRFELVEARERRYHFQRAACRELAIGNVTPRLGRIENLAVAPAPLVIAQAVGPIGDVTRISRRWLVPGGWLIVPSGDQPSNHDPGPGWRQHGTRPYPLPGSLRQRTLWFGERSVEPVESP